MSERIRKAKRRQAIELMVVMGVYMASVFATVTFAKTVDDKFLLALAAMVPTLMIAAACFIFYRTYRRMDERQQQIQTKAAAFTLIVAIIVASGVGFLKSFGVFVREDDFIWFVAFLIVVWGLARRFMGDGC